MLGEIYAQGLEAAGYTVSKDLNLGDQDTALAAVKKGEISAYPEYTGTALLAFFDKKADELPKEPAGRLTRRPRRASRPRAWWPSRRRRSPPPTRSR